MCDSWNAVTYKKLVKSSKACEQWTEQQCQALDTLVQAKANTATLYNAILRIAKKFLETRENIKISTHPFYHKDLG